MGKTKRHKHPKDIFLKEVEIVNMGKISWKYTDKLVEFILGFLGMSSMAWCFVSGLKIEVMAMQLNIGILLLVLFFFSLFHIKQYSKHMIGIYVIFNMIYAFSFRNKIAEGFRIVSNRFIELFNFYYQANVVKFLLQGRQVEECNTVFYILVLSLLIGLFSFVRWEKNRPLLSLFFTTPMITLLLVVGVLPNSIYFAMYVIFCIAVIGGGAKNLQNSQVRGKILRLLLGIGMGLFLGAFILVSPADYQTKVDIKKVKKTMQTTIINFSKSDFWKDSIVGDWFHLGDGVASGGLSGGKLGRTDQVIFTNEVALTVTTAAKIKDRTYLRGYIGAWYSEDLWEQLSQTYKTKYEDLLEEFEQAGISEETIGTWFINGSKQSEETWKMEVKNVNTERKSRFLPYYTKDKVRINKNGIIFLPKGKEKRKYSFDFYPYFNQELSRYLGSPSNDMERKSAIAIELEQKYRNFVYQAYTELGAWDSRAIHLFEEEKMQSEDVSTYEIFTRVQRVRDYLNQTTVYSLAPGMLPQGKDFVDYFLFENAKGYCTHYASAATILMRSMGIPARYVEGYVISPYDISSGSLSKETNKISIELKDSNAHAWVEVYVNEIGWVPVEVTPGYGVESQIPQAIRDQIENNKNGITPYEQVGPTRTVNPYNTLPSPPAIKNQNGKGRNFFGRLDMGDSWGYFNKLLQIMGVAVVFLFLFILVGLMSKAYWIWQRRTVLKRDDNREKILFFSKQLDKIFKNYGLLYQGEACQEYAKRVENQFSFLEKGSFEKMYIIILRVGFSKSQIEKEQVNVVMEFYDSFGRELKKEKNRMKKRFYKNMP